VQVLDSTATPIILKQAEQRVSAEGFQILFPAGMYVADFKTKTGTYYRAPDKLSLKTDAETRVAIGGVYVPTTADPDQRQGAWLEEKEAGEFRIKVSGLKRTYRFSEGIAF